MGYGRTVLIDTPVPEAIPMVKEALKASTQRAIDAGAFGAPFFVCKGEPYWGCDRMFLIEEALVKR